MIKSSTARDNKTQQVQQHTTTSIDEVMEIDENAMNYDFAMKEVILKELNSGKLSFQ